MSRFLVTVRVRYKPVDDGGAGWEELYWLGADACSGRFPGYTLSLTTNPEKRVFFTSLRGALREVDNFDCLIPPAAEVLSILVLNESELKKGGPK